MAGYTWDTRELLILEAVRAAEEAGTSVPSAANDCLPDLDERRHVQALVSLIEDNYLEGTVYREGGGQVNVTVLGISPKGRREVGQWPKTDPVAAFEQALQAAIDREPDGEQKSKLTRVKEAALSLGGDTLRAVIVAAATRATGI